MKNVVYNFLTPGVFGKITAQAAMEELERIRLKHGELKPEYVVEESKEPDALLHNYFQWDDTLAAAAWRREQARQLIKNITVTITTENITSTVRAIVNVVKADNPGRSYIPIVEAMLDDAAKNDLFEQAKAEMQSFITKYSQIEQLGSVKREMLAVLNGIQL